MKARIESIEYVDEGDERVYFIKENGIVRILRVKIEDDLIYPMSNDELSSVYILDKKEPEYRTDDIE